MDHKRNVFIRIILWKFFFDDKHTIHTVFYRRNALLHRFTYQSLHPVSRGCPLIYFCRNDDGKTRDRSGLFVHEFKKGITDMDPTTEYVRYILCGKSVELWKHSSHRQFFSSGRSTTLKHFPANLRLHTASESMHACAFFLFWLVCSLWHMLSITNIIMLCQLFLSTL